STVYPVVERLSTASTAAICVASRSTLAPALFPHSRHIRDTVSNSASRAARSVIVPFPPCSAQSVRLPPTPTEHRHRLQRAWEGSSSRIYKFSTTYHHTSAIGRQAAVLRSRRHRLSSFGSFRIALQRQRRLRGLAPGHLHQRGLGLLKLDRQPRPLKINVHQPPPQRADAFLLPRDRVGRAGHSPRLPFHDRRPDRRLGDRKSVV